MICDYGAKPAPPSPFFYDTEVWPGIEYQVAAQLFHEGKTEAAPRDRARRCGRATTACGATPGTKPSAASTTCGRWRRGSAVWLLLGFHYHAAERRVRLAPRLAADPVRGLLVRAVGLGELHLDRAAAARRGSRSRSSGGRSRAESWSSRAVAATLATRRSSCADAAGRRRGTASGRGAGPRRAREARSDPSRAKPFGRIPLVRGARRALSASARSRLTSLSPRTSIARSFRPARTADGPRRLRCTAARWMVWFAVVVLLSWRRRGALRRRPADRHPRGPRARRRGRTAAGRDHQPERAAGPDLVHHRRRRSVPLRSAGGRRLHRRRHARGAGLDRDQGCARKRPRERVELKLGGTTAEQITVTSEAPLISKFETSASATIESEVSSNLSFVARNVQSSVEVLPGVVHTAQSRLQARHPGVGQWRPVAGERRLRRRRRHQLRPPRRSVAHLPAGDVADRDQDGDRRFLRRVRPRGLGRDQLDHQVGHQPVPRRLPLHPAEREVARRVRRARHPARRRHQGQLRDLARRPDRPRQGVVLRQLRQDRQQRGRPARQRRPRRRRLRCRRQDPQAQLPAVGQAPAPARPASTRRPTRSRSRRPAATSSRPATARLDENLATLTWSFAITNSAFLETKVATQEDELDRAALVSARHRPGSEPGVAARQQLPLSGPAHQPPLQRHRAGRRAGQARHRREQANASLALFRGDHEIKFGADYQDVSQETFNFIGVLFRGRGYNPSASRWVRRRRGQARVRSHRAGRDHRGGAVGLRAGPLRPHRPLHPLRRRAHGRSGLRQRRRDRGELVDRLRAAPGRHLRPRRRGHHAAQGQRRPLLPGDRAGHLQPRVRHQAERHQPVHPVPLEPGHAGATTSVAEHGAGPRIQSGHVRSLLQGRGEPRVEWQFMPAWAFEARANWWEVDDTFWTHRSVERRRPGGARRAQLGRRLPRIRGRSSSSSIARCATTGRCAPTTPTARTTATTSAPATARIDDDDLFEALGGVERRHHQHRRYNTANREGRGNTDREHNLNIVGLKVFPVSAKNDIGLGGYFGFRSGERWGLRPEHRGGAPGRAGQRADHQHHRLSRGSRRASRWKTPTRST